MIIIVVFALAQWGPIKDFLAKGATEFTWPGTGDIQNAKGEAPTATTFKFGWLRRAAGTLLLVSGLHHDGRAAGLPGRARAAPTARCSTSSSGRR